ncbi:MAG TPA: hypothetical protein VLG28_09180 [Acidimicrobiia bacterium]|jgi:hypothetical protein|nr:hypothetical protein [Acidimicrobiia bacterium]
MDQVLVAVDVPLVGDERRKNWAKVVTNVDPSKASGWAFEGEFIAAGGIQDVPAGAVVLVYGERGSRTNPASEARVFTANADGTLSPEAQASGRAWARTLRDRVVELLEREAPLPQALDWSPELMRYSDAAVAEEMRRRNLGAGEA